MRRNIYDETTNVSTDGATTLPQSSSLFANTSNLYAGTSNDTLDMDAAINTTFVPVNSPSSKVRTSVNNSEFIEAEYIRKSYTLPSNATRQTIGLDPNVLNRYARGDANLINSTIDSTSQESDRKLSLNIANLEMTKAVKFSNNAASIVQNPNAVGNLSNSNLLYAKTLLNTNNTNVKIVLTPDSKQVFLQENGIEQQIDLFEEERS